MPLGKLKTSIAVKLTGITLLLVFMTSSMMYYFANREAEQTLRKEIISELRSLTRRGVDNIDRFMFERIADLRVMARDPLVLEAIQKEDGETLSRRLAQLKHTNEMYFSLSAFTMERLRLADTEFRNVNKVHSYSKYWKMITFSTDVIMDISISESLERPVMHFAGVVRNEHGEAEGVIVARVLIEELYGVFANLYLDSNPEIQNSLNVDLVDKEGKLLYSNHNPEGILTEHFSRTDLLKDLKQRQNALIEDEDFFYFYAPERGYQSFKGHQWGLITGVEREVAFQPITDLTSKLLQTILGITLLTTVVALVFARRFSRPILELTKAADQIGDGQLDVKVNIRTHDEIAELGEHLQDMATHLKERMEAQAQLNQKLNHALGDIEVKNKALMGSIRYAERIQQAMLPEKEELKTHFKDSFILYLPRDIVSGDFFWFEEVEEKSTGTKHLVVAAADCTGHGVPGAIMSMLGSNLLTNIVCYGQIAKPADILTRLNRDIIVELHQEVRKDNSQDGMEIGLCSFDFAASTFYYAGAGRPLFLFRDGQLLELKGTRQTVGGVNPLARKHGIRFYVQDVSVVFQSGDVLYMFSDGYPDQLGGPNDRKFSKKALKRLLLEIHQLPMEEQQHILIEHFKGWKGEGRQIDDILVMGLRL